jgi:hypothetical protein
MKTMTCEICSHPMSAETFEQWTEQAKVHWMQQHSDIMQQMKEAGKGAEDAAKWMAAAQAKFEALPLDE